MAKTLRHDVCCYHFMSHNTLEDIVSSFKNNFQIWEGDLSDHIDTPTISRHKI